MELVDELYTIFSFFSFSLQIHFQAFPYPEYMSEDPLMGAIAGLVFGVVIVGVGILSMSLINDIVEEKDSGVKV